MKSQAFSQLLQVLATDPVLQAQCVAMGDLAQLIQLPQQAGFAITVRELQLWANDDAFPPRWYPWARAGTAKRTALLRGFDA